MRLIGMILGAKSVPEAGTIEPLHHIVRCPSLCTPLHSMERPDGFKHLGKTDDSCRQSRVNSDLQLRKSRRIDQVSVAFISEDAGADCGINSFIGDFHAARVHTDFSMIIIGFFS